jgi:hypothetical protein
MINRSGENILFSKIDVSCLFCFIFGGLDVYIVNVGGMWAPCLLFCVVCINSYAYEFCLLTLHEDLGHGRRLVLWILLTRERSLERCI